MIRNIVLLTSLVTLVGGTLRAQDKSELAKKAQNPVAAMISLPIQNNTSFGIGEFDRTQNVMNIQPVIPFAAGPVNIITRTIAPLVYQPDVTQPDGGTFGLGDVNATVFVSPSEPSSFVWAAGPVITIPTGTDRAVGTGKLGLGPSFLALTMRGPWVAGALVNNVWSVAGKEDRSDINSFLLQYFINYNLPNGWYLSTAPIMTANWKADEGNKWLVPVGGGFGKVLRIGSQPMNAAVQAFYHVEKPEGGPGWGLRLQLQFLFPK